MQRFIVLIWIIVILYGPIIILKCSGCPSLFSDGNGMIYTGSSDGFSFYGIDKLSGKIDYKIKTNSYTFSSPAINKMAYIGSANGRLYGIDLDQKKVLGVFNGRRKN